LSSSINDGSANALAGAPEFPNLLAGYAVRPPWEVAGVNYAVGVPVGLALKDPSTIKISGVSVDTANHQVTVNTNSPITISGIDFSLDGGWQLIIGDQVASNNVTVTDSNFAIGSNGNAMVNQVHGSNTVFMYDTFNGNGLNDNVGGSVFTLDGGMTLEYSLVENEIGDFIDYGYNNTVKYNVFDLNGTSPVAHSDWLQLGAGTSPAYNQDFEYNTFYQPTANGPDEGTQGLGFGDDGAGPITMGTIITAYNTFVTQAGAQVSYVMGVYVPELTGTATTHDNYYDLTGSQEFSLYAAAPNSTFSNNVNMVTGSGLGSGSGTGTGSGSGAGSGSGPDPVAVADSANTQGQTSIPATVTDTGSGSGQAPVAVADSANTQGQTSSPATVTDTGSGAGLDPVAVADSANTEGQTSSPATAVADTQGSVSAPATVNLMVSPSSSGSGGSGGGAPGAQLPNLFAGYAVRPSWQVAGVDYSLGVPSSTTLKDPTAISMRGVSVNATSHVITVYGGGVVLNGYDFSLNGGW
jgi:hypothetical protein